MKTEAPITFLGMTMPRIVRWNFLSEGLNTVFSGIFIGIIGPFAYPLAVRLGATDLMLFIFTAAPFVGNLLSPLWAMLSQNQSKKWWVVTPHILWRAGMGLVGFFTGAAPITAMQAATNLATSAGNPAYGALIQKIYPAPIRGRLMGYVRLIMAAFMLPTTLIAGPMIDRYGPKWIFLFGGVCALIGISCFACIREPKDDIQKTASAKRPNPIEGLKMAVADSKFRRFLIAALFFHGGILVASPLFSPYQVRVMGLNNSQISYISLAWNIAWLAAFAFWGRVIDRKGPWPVVAAAAAFYLGAPLAYAFGGGLLPIILLGSMCLGIADAAMDMGSWNIILSVNPDRVGPYTAASMLVTGIRGLLGPFAATRLMGLIGFQPTFLTAAALISIGLVIFVTERRAQASAQVPA